MRFLKSEAGAVILWLAGTIPLAAILFPWVFRLGKCFAAYTAKADLPGILESIGKSAATADVDRYFSRSLYLAVLLLLPLLIWRLKVIRRESPRPALKSPPLPWKTRLLHLGSAILLAAGLLWLLGIILEAKGAYLPSHNLPSAGKFFAKALAPAVFGSVIEECLFRGLLLGIWLRIARPLPALLGTSFIFAFLHFMSPPPGTQLADPAALGAGFQLLGLILQNFLNPQFIAAEFATLFTVGLILGAARLRTGALWFSIGLHGGWIFALKGFNLLHESAPSPLRPLWIGETLRSGLLPLITLLLTAVICHFTLRCSKAPAESPRS